MPGCCMHFSTSFSPCWYSFSTLAPLKMPLQRRIENAAEPRLGRLGPVPWSVPRQFGVSSFDHLPVNVFPPRIEIGTFSQNTIVRKVHMLPHVDAQNGPCVQGACVVFGFVLRVIAHGACRVRSQVDAQIFPAQQGGQVASIVVGHVPRVASCMRLRIGRARVVCAQDGQLILIGNVFHQPDKPVAEHGVGCFQYLDAELVYRVEHLFNVLPRRNPGLPLRRHVGVAQGLPEEMGVVGHRGVVVQCGVAGLVRILSVDVKDGL